MCYTVRDYEITSPPWAYSAAYFQSYGEGMVGGKTRIPDGWRPEVSCVVRAPDTRCRLTYKHTPDVQWQISQRDIYTTVRGRGAAGSVAQRCRRAAGGRWLAHGAAAPASHPTRAATRRTRPLSTASRRPAITRSAL